MGLPGTSTLADLSTAIEKRKNKLFNIDILLLNLNYKFYLRPIIIL